MTINYSTVTRALFDAINNDLATINKAVSAGIPVEEAMGDTLTGVRDAVKNLNKAINRDILKSFAAIVDGKDPAVARADFWKEYPGNRTYHKKALVVNKESGLYSLGDNKGKTEVLPSHLADCCAIAFGTPAFVKRINVFTYNVQAALINEREEDDIAIVAQPIPANVASDRHKLAETEDFWENADGGALYTNEALRKQLKAIIRAIIPADSGYTVNPPSNSRISKVSTALCMAQVTNKGGGTVYSLYTPEVVEAHIMNYIHDAINNTAAKVVDRVKRTETNGAPMAMPPAGEVSTPAPAEKPAKKSGKKSA